MIKVHLVDNSAHDVHIVNPGDDIHTVRALGEVIHRYITIDDISFKEVDPNGNYIYTITMTDGTTYEFTSPRGPIGETGNGISRAYLNADYTLTLEFTDGTSYTTPVIRGETGVGVETILWLSGDHSPGTFDVYRILLTDGNYTDFEVYNGADGHNNVQYDTTAGWNAQLTLVAAANTLYVYTDHILTETGYYLPGFKIGDGNAYLIDIPFADSPIDEHMADSEIHITQEEREFWNSKERCYVDASAPETLIFTKD